MRLWWDKYGMNFAYPLFRINKKRRVAMLKMKRNFFDDQRIRAVRKYPQGDRYIMIYTMLVGISERNAPHFSLVSEQGRALSDAEIAGICHVNDDLFGKAMLLLDANGLVDRVNGTVFVNTNQLFESVG